jgi:hypothetical protein
LKALRRVSSQDLDGPLDLVLGALTAGLPSAPQLEVRWPIVKSVTVSVVHRLVVVQGPSEHLRHHETMFGERRLPIR